MQKKNVFDELSPTSGGFYEVWYEMRGIPGLRLRPAGQEMA